MKKPAILSILIFSSLFSLAQLQFTVEAGFANTQNHIKKNLVGGSTYNRFSAFKGGIIIKSVLDKRIVAESGIFYDPKGY